MIPWLIKSEMAFDPQHGASLLRISVAKVHFFEFSVAHALYPGDGKFTNAEVSKMLASLAEAVGKAHE